MDIRIKHALFLLRLPSISVKTTFNTLETYKISHKRFINIEGHYRDLSLTLP